MNGTSVTVTVNWYFYPRSPCGERRVILFGMMRTGNFYPRSPCGERRSAADLPRPVQDFYPRSPCGERQGSHVNGCKKSRFLSTLSLRRATPQHTKRLLQPRNFYPRSPCGERHGACGQLDFAWVFLSTLSWRRATPAVIKNRTAFSVFLSTLSLRRATSALLACRPGHRISIHALLAESDKYLTGGKIQHPDFYPRSPCGERHPAAQTYV